jgi:hypothetical protein
MKTWMLLMMVVALTGCVDVRENPPMPIEKLPYILMEPKEAEEVQFVEHIDGDTSKFRIHGKVETVQYLLIDTPETNQCPGYVKDLWRKSGVRGKEANRHKT